jgi:hypothetical protein
MSLKNLVEGQCGGENALVNLSRQLQQNLGGFPSSAAPRWRGTEQGGRDEVINQLREIFCSFSQNTIQTNIT